ncbi:conserved hypothetical protein [Talaromyces stipitatus ATCC 10500]|uniref:DDE-1 domain-containing protein n=1 Tax=Talaromyces stipitatus (strain ATCC 10500 / CBS 375.48 / QM 6759 / NRRL 1006) TaxID=441959 RepID=B8MGF4_TALSN|nr:uncharacterized protein TSTA_013740 [Talaromyces stipitatus ATCC 10500]EED16274.1 conserved hypothetical protein [Talaromyces stipitatus ATCC 10500]
MPPHSSHLLQPLDVGFFSVLKRLYGAAVESQIRFGIYNVDKLDFLDMLYSVWNQTYTTQNIKGCFSPTGIVPIIRKKSHLSCKLLSGRLLQPQLALARQATASGAQKRLTMPLGRTLTYTKQMISYRSAVLAVQEPYKPIVFLQLLKAESLLRSSLRGQIPSSTTQWERAFTASSTGSPKEL